MRTWTFASDETAACLRLLKWALAEDLGDAGDLTSQAVLEEDAPGQAVFVARQQGVLAGLSAAKHVFVTLDDRVQWQSLTEDGAWLRPGTELAQVSGPLRSILTGERCALNFVQHLSGIATLTRRYVEAVAGWPAQILDTRKTLPGWRLLAKYAVRCGGGHNHRMGLYDGILIKDNHLAGLPHSEAETPITAALRRVQTLRADRPTLPLEIEVDTLAQLDEALRHRPDMVLLDNMTPAQLRQAVERRNAVAVGVLLEASGGITLDNVRDIAATGVERISIGALTHSAPALDIGLDYRD